MNERIIPAYIDLRDIRHDQRTSIASGDPIFPDWESFRMSIENMEGALNNLIDEYGAQKKELSELQLKAEDNRSLQEQVWNRLLELPYLSDLLAERGPIYGSFRSEYEAALTAMRANLAGKRAPGRQEATVVADDSKSPGGADLVRKRSNEENDPYMVESPDD